MLGFFCCECMFWLGFLIILSCCKVWIIKLCWLLNFLVIVLGVCVCVVGCSTCVGVFRLGCCYVGFGLILVRFFVGYLLG